MNSSSFAEQLDVLARRTHPLAYPQLHQLLHPEGPQTCVLHPPTTQAHLYLIIQPQARSLRALKITQVAYLEDHNRYPRASILTPQQSNTHLAWDQRVEIHRELVNGWLRLNAIGRLHLLRR